jgi:peptidoglycan/LPS O-acetylase OafA/YrhL
MEAQENPSSKPMIWEPWFDWIRLFIALEVVFLHIPITHRLNPFLVLPINPVPAFVAISGYLVFRSLRKHDDIKRFWVSRVLRVIPAFLFSLVLVRLVAGQQALTDSFESYLFMRPVITGPGSNFALWSLLIEELLYGILAALYVSGFFRSSGANRLLFWLAFCIFALYALMRQYHPSDVEPTYLAILMSFFAGTFMVDSPYLPFVQRWCWVFLGVSAAGALAWGYLDDMVVRGVVFILMTIGGSFGVIGLGTSSAPIPRLKWDLSYGVYVMHLIAMHLVDKLPVNGWVFVVCTFVATLGLAAVSWNLVEAPAFRWKKRILGNTPG